MGIWILMLCVNLLIPAAMVGFGRWFLQGGPQDINRGIGYRTSMSMKNKDTWVFAHQEIGRLWSKWGTALLAATVAGMLSLLGKDEDMIANAGSILMFAQMIPLIGCIFPVERKLRDTFDEDGNRKAAGG